MKNSGRTPTPSLLSLCFGVIALCGGNLFGTLAAASTPQSELIVQFVPNTATFASPYAELPVTEIIADSALANTLIGMGAVTGRKVFPAYTSADTIRFLDNGDTVYIPDLSQVVVLKFNTEGSLSTVLADLASEAGVLTAEPNALLSLDRVPSDPDFHNQPYLQSNPILVDLDMITAWNDTTGSPTLRIGIIDSGIRYMHEDFGGALGAGAKVMAGYNYITNSMVPFFDDESHGTSVAGIVGALTNNKRNGQFVGLAGIVGGWGYDYDAGTGNLGPKLVSLNTYDPATGGNVTAAVANAIVEGSDPQRYNCRILNMSFGGASPSYVLEKALSVAVRLNTVLVASKGRDGSGNPVYPADFSPSWMLAVGSVDENGNKSSFSQTGHGIDVVGLGDYTKAVDNDDDTDYTIFNGTSATAPQATGLAALLLSVRPDLHPEDVEGIITRSADDLGPPGKDEATGYGTMNAGKTLSYLKQPWALLRSEVTGGTIAATSEAYWQQFDTIGLRYVVRYDVRKSVTLPGGFVTAPYVWGRGTNVSTGWLPTSVANMNYEVGYCNVTASTATTAELQTFVYRRVDLIGPTSDYYPMRPADVRFGYTVLGEYPPLTATINGPDTLSHNTSGTWTAVAAGGSGGYAYQWRWRTDPSGSWSGVDGTSSTYTRTLQSNDVQLQLVVTSGTASVTSTKWCYHRLPRNVEDLTFAGGRTTGVAAWTEPGQINGDAEAYDVRYNTATAITEGNFYSSFSAGSAGTPGAAGTPHCIEIPLSQCHTYYFAMKTRFGSVWSPISNVASGSTKCSGYVIADCEGLGLLAGGGGGEEGLRRQTNETSATAGVGPMGGQDVPSVATENSLFSGSTDLMTDLCKLSGNTGAANGKYLIRLREVGDQTAEIDQLGLGFVDRSPELESYAGSDGVFLGTTGPVEGVQDDGGRPLTGLSDAVIDSAFVATKGAGLVVALGTNPGSSALIISTKGPAAEAVVDSSGIYVQIPDPKTVWRTIATFHPRREVDTYAVDVTGQSQVRLACLGPYQILGVRRMSVSKKVTPSPLTLVAASHSRLGDVADAISKAGGATAVLQPGDSLNLAFTAEPPQTGMTRDCFIAAKGMYQKSNAVAARSSEMALQSTRTQTWTFGLSAAHPNPSNGRVSFGYTLARSTMAALRLYNVAGRLVRTVVQEQQEAGPHEALWDGMDDNGARSPAGVYFYRLQADTWSSERKLVLIQR